MILRYLSQNHSTKPVTYEYYLQQLKRFERTRHSNEQVTAGLIEFIHFNRQLQRTNKVVVKNFLNIILTPPNSKLELALWKLLNEHSIFYENDQIFKKYLNVKPQPTNVDNVFHLTEKVFHNQLNRGKVDISVVNNSLNVLLDQKDYYNGFKLIDLTVNSPKYLQYLKSNVRSFFKNYFYYNVCLSGLSSYFLPLFPFHWLCLLNLFASSLIFLANLQLVTKIGKLSWRSYNSFSHNYLHQHELLAISKILTHYEEHNEVNLRNFHHSKVRFQSNLNVFNHDEYILELPTNSQQLIPLNQSNQHHDTNLHLQQYFRHQLYKRKLVLGELPEELMFFEYWLTNGDNFEWVEPDQDPAEILKLKINNKS